MMVRLSTGWLNIGRSRCSGSSAQSLASECRSSTRAEDDRAVMLRSVWTPETEVRARMDCRVFRGSEAKPDGF